MPDRAALVTGASSGIGLAIADLLGQEGHGLTVAARRPEKLAAGAEGARGKGYDVEGGAPERARPRIRRPAGPGGGWADRRPPPPGEARGGCRGAARQGLRRRGGGRQ